MTSRDIPPPKRDLEINEEGSTMDRFLDLTGKLLRVSREEVLQKEKEFKDEQKINKRNKSKDKT
jgi:hypothetical protein